MSMCGSATLSASSISQAFQRQLIKAGYLQCVRAQEAPQFVISSHPLHSHSSRIRTKEKIK